MERMFEEVTLGKVKLTNRFVFPPIKLGYGRPDGAVTERQIAFYRQIARNGPAVVILEPVAVTADGREHPKQPCIHLENSREELQKIVDGIHAEGRLVCLHLNHAGGASNPQLTGAPPRAPSEMTCTAREERVATALTEPEIDAILAGYGRAAQTAAAAGFDLIEIQAGHGYLISQFLSKALNRRTDRYGRDRMRFAREAIWKVMEGAPKIPCILRISGDEMSPDFGVRGEAVLSLLEYAESAGICAIHVGMGNACFSPPWYFHHGSLPEKPQNDALAWIREQTYLPIIAAGRMGRRERVQQILDDGLADLVALGRPLIADPDLVAKWRADQDEDIRYCGYCLQGCLHRLKSGEPLGCNLNPEIGLPPLPKTEQPMSVLVAGGGPAGMSAALYLNRRGHRVTLAERSGHLGGQYALAWQAPGKAPMKDGLAYMARALEKSGAVVDLSTEVDPDYVHRVHPDLLVWATGAVSHIPNIPGMDNQHRLTAVEFLDGDGDVRGQRVLVIGAGRSGLEIAEMLGKGGYDVVATKRTDPIGSMMETITRKLTLMRIDRMPNVTLLPRTTVIAFHADTVEIEQDGVRQSVEPFDTVIFASGMMSAAAPSDAVRESAGTIEIIGDAGQVNDIFSAVHAGYDLARRH